MYWYFYDIPQFNFVPAKQSTNILQKHRNFEDFLIKKHRNSIREYNLYNINY